MMNPFLEICPINPFIPHLLNKNFETRKLWERPRKMAWCNAMANLWSDFKNCDSHSCRISLQVDPLCFNHIFSLQYWSYNDSWCIGKVTWWSKIETYSDVICLWLPVERISQGFPRTLSLSLCFVLVLFLTYLTQP
jgi:hypothetical protein